MDQHKIQCPNCHGLTGFFDGCFVCLLGPIVYDIVGPQNASHGIGFLLGLLSIPMITGPPLAGKSMLETPSNWQQKYPRIRKFVSNVYSP